CCTQALQSFQPDFQVQKGELEETLEAAAYLVIIYPIFHCQLNFMEYFWGRAKLYTSANGEYTFYSIVSIVPEALAQILNELIWKYYQHILRIMDAYRQNLVYGSDDFKKHVFTRYSSYRYTAESVLCI
ncbi:hypothetical protein L873DRAFT_1723843, partial [Choiromyces venosus 120613-1]